MGSYLTPMQVCEALLGKPEEIGLAAGLHPKSTFLWRRASGERDAGDLPSARVMRRLLAHSRERGLGLTARHLVEGATEDEVAAILAARHPAATSAPEAGQAVAA
jgi:hypothetical protein